MLLKIEVLNETGKNYFSLDSKDFTLYPDEEEVLLVAGILPFRSPFDLRTRALGKVL